MPRDDHRRVYSHGTCFQIKLMALYIAQSGWGARLTFEFATGAQLAT
jgi:hypothetical protein